MEGSTQEETLQLLNPQQLALFFLDPNCQGINTVSFFKEKKNLKKTNSFAVNNNTVNSNNNNNNKNRINGDSTCLLEHRQDIPAASNRGSSK